MFSNGSTLRQRWIYVAQETGTYYLRARYYDPSTGRFTQEDPHWGSANSIYGDTPMAAFKSKDALGLTYTSYAPQIFAIQQSGNLYVYCIGNPVDFADPSGQIITPGQLKLILGFVSGAITTAYAYILETEANGGEINIGEMLLYTGIGAISGLLQASAKNIYVQLVIIVIQVIVEAWISKDLNGALINGVSYAVAALMGCGIKNSIKVGIPEFTKIEEVANAIAGTMGAISIETIEETGETIAKETGTSSEENEPDDSTQNQPSSSVENPDPDNDKDEEEISPPSGGGGGVDGSSPGQNGGVNKDIRRTAMP